MAGEERGYNAKGHKEEQTQPSRKPEQGRPAQGQSPAKHHGKSKIAQKRNTPDRTQLTTANRAQGQRRARKKAITPTHNKCGQCRVSANIANNPLSCIKADEEETQSKGRDPHFLLPQHRQVIVQGLQGINPRRQRGGRVKQIRERRNSVAREYQAPHKSRYKPSGGNVARSREETRKPTYRNRRHTT